MSCEFCEGAGKALCRAELNGMVANVQIVNRKLVADLFRDYMEMEIKFCPMCGKPLTEPQPLTLDELRGMDGEPVYFKHLHGDWKENGWHVMAGSSDLSNYGITWLAYRRPPKEDVDRGEKV